LKEVSKKAAEVAEKEMIQNTLQETHWNRKRAAKLLHVSYKALLYKIQKYRLDDRRGYPTIEEEAG
jgi:two-component system response regulator AtoC